MDDGQHAVDLAATISEAATRSRSHGGWPVASKARRIAREVKDLVHTTTGQRVAVQIGLASDLDHDAIRVPITWPHRTRSIRAWTARPIVRVYGVDHVIIDAHVIHPPTERATEHHWRVVAVRRATDGQGCAVIAGVLRRSATGWRLARTASDARRRPTPATRPDDWIVRRVDAGGR